MEKGTPQIHQNTSGRHMSASSHKKNRNVLGDTFLQWGRSCSLLKTALGEAVSGALLNWGIAKTYINVLGGYA